MLDACGETFRLVKVFVSYPLSSGRDFVVTNLVLKWFVGFMVFVGGFVG